MIIEEHREKFKGGGLSLNRILVEGGRAPFPSALSLSRQGCLPYLNGLATRVGTGRYVFFEGRGRVAALLYRFSRVEQKGMLVNIFPLPRDE